MEDILKIIGIIILVFLIIFILVKSLKLQFSFMKNIEGMTSSSSSSLLNGFAGNAKNFAESIKALSTKITDQLLVSKYRSNYEDIIINLEDYINLLMLNITLNTNMTGSQDDIIKSLEQIGKLNNTKIALNDVMSYVDKLS